MNENARLNVLIGLALMLTVVFLVIALIQNAHGKDKQLCHMEPGVPISEWHYRTKIDGKSWKCWYEGPRMKPRSELYWAEVPTVPKLIEPNAIENLPWQLEPRWQGNE